ncbi:retrotransposon protein, putative, ty1-copia subclass [Tanacetum coccineum]
MTKSPFIGSCERGKGLLDLVHTDVCGPFRSTTKDGKLYYITFTDDFSRYGYVYLIKHKSDTFEVFKMYQNKLTPPRTPQLNRVAERINRTLLDMVRSMMSRATLPISFWDESFGYLFYKPKDNVVFVAQRGVFLEREMISKDDNGSKIDLEEIQESANEEPIVNTNTQQSNSTLSELDEPANYKEAMASPEAAKWKEAMKSEIQSMYDNQVWNLVDTMETDIQNESQKRPSTG